VLARVLGAQHRRPLRVPIDDQAVICPLTRREQAVLACVRCPYLQGSLEGPEPALLCAAPARRPRRGRLPRGRRLYFDRDWPEEPG
jgi:hypothetical protein